MDAILDIARRRRLSVVEDNAHGLLGRYKGRYLGTFGALAAQSFHETKNFSCGEGGALIINDESYRARAEIIREKGTNRTQFFQGLVDKYTWVDIGSSYLPSEISAAYLVAQLEHAEQIQERRRGIWCRYYDRLRPWADRVGATLPVVPDDCGQAYHMFYVVLRSFEERLRLIQELKRQDIHATFHYVSLHLSPMGARFGAHRGDCPVSERASTCLLRLPFYTGLSEADQERVISAVTGVTFCR